MYVVIILQLTVKVTVKETKVEGNMKNNKHVVQNKNGGWDVKSGGAPVAHQRTQKDAIQVANSIAKRDRTEVIIHGRDGKIRDKNSFGNDPFPPKG